MTGQRNGTTELVIVPLEKFPTTKGQRSPVDRRDAAADGNCELRKRHEQLPTIQPVERNDLVLEIHIHTQMGADGSRATAESDKSEMGKTFSQFCKVSPTTGAEPVS